MMLSRRSFVLGSAVLCFGAPRFAALAHAFPLRRNSTLPLGDTPVVVRTVWNGPGPRFFHPHEDETTSLHLADTAVMQRGGISVSLHHGGGRYIDFTMSGKKYRIDPNRIFTPEGTKRTLGAAPAYVADVVNAFAAQVARAVLRGRAARDVVIGMHNNTPGAYSVKNYAAGGDSVGDVAAVFVNAHASADDFFLTTERQLFDALKSRQYNIVLQKSPPAHNDGSFSVFCDQHGVPYVNIEATKAHGAMQARMLRDLIGVLSPAV